MTINFHPPHFYFVMQCRHPRVFPRKELSVGIGFFSIKSQFSKENNDSKLHRLFLRHFNEFLKNIVEEILKIFNFFQPIYSPISSLTYIQCVPARMVSQNSIKMTRGNQFLIYWFSF